MSIPTICDRCRSTGIAGEGDFSHLGDLLDFTPVPVQPRVNGWDADAQRAFIALLATTGSKRKAALAIGRNAHGIDQLLKREDSGSFRLAFDRAIAIARANGSMKIAQGVADAAARNAQLTPPSRLQGLPAPGTEEEDSEATEEYKLELLQGIAGKFMRKVAAERRARLAGEIVAADFYLRQITIIEVIFDLTSTSFGLDPREVLHNLRRARHGLIEIVDTPFAHWLDRQRREWWRQEGEPDRPPHPDARFIERHRAADGEECSTYVDQDGTGATTTPARGYPVEEWAALGSEEQRLARAKQFEQDAAEQRAWEARAVAEHRRARSHLVALHKAGEVVRGRPVMRDRAIVRAPFAVGRPLSVIGLGIHSVLVGIRHFHSPGPPKSSHLRCLRARARLRCGQTGTRYSRVVRPAL